MKYYIIKFPGLPTEVEHRGKQYSCANGDRISDDDNYFKRMRDGELLKDSPVFGSFFLDSYAPPHTWDWILLDVFDIRGKAEGIGWLVSPEFKEMLETLNIANAHCFHPSKLLFRGEEKDVYIFQYIDSSQKVKENNRIIDFENSVFLDSKSEERLVIHDVDHHRIILNEFHSTGDYRHEILASEIVLKEEVDFFKLCVPGIAFVIVSQRFKDAFENKGFKALTFELLKGYNKRRAAVKDLNVTVRKSC